jgi:plasmid stabilization system protein ParE
MADPVASAGERRGERAAGKGSVRDASEPPGAPASAASDAFAQSADRIGEQVREAAGELLREQKERVAAAVHGLADALRQAAHTFEREESRVAARYIDQAAAQIDRLSETMRRQTLPDMLASAEDIARRQPALFVTGAVAIGFVMGRVLWRGGDGRTRRSEGYAMTAGESSYHHAGSAPPSGSGVEPS